MAYVALGPLRALVDEGYLTARENRDGLIIWNYTAKAQFEKYWLAETMMCRGLITDQQGKIVARPFPKFFNYGERDVELPADSFEVYEKMDGSLGILYQSDDIPFIATRGSFDSDQAYHATMILRDKYHDYAFDPNLTYLFEIVYPGNRIVVDYGNMDDIILLAVIETGTGRELSLDEIGETPFPKVKRYDGVTDISKIKELGRENQEGFVVRFTKSNLRIKIKMPEYLRLHRLMTEVSERKIWELLKEQKPMTELYERVPDEYYAWVKEVVNRIQGQFRHLHSESNRIYREIGESAVIDLPFIVGSTLTYKQAKRITGLMSMHVLEEYKKYPELEPILTRMHLDGNNPKKIADLIWDMVYPPATKGFRIIGEATN